MRQQQLGLELDLVAAEFYSDLRLSPFLRRLLTRSGDLLGAVAGSISLVDSPREHYTKMAERGASCQLGQTFPLDQGVTGQVVARRRPVVLSSYQEISAGHLPDGHPAGRGAVVAVPIWWRGDVIGVNVTFAGRERRFTAQEVDSLELLTQLAAPGIVKAGASDPSLANMIREYRRQDAAVDGLRTVVTEVGRARPVAPSVAGVALDLVTLAERAAARREPTARLHVAVVHRADGLRLLVYDDAADPPGGASIHQAGLGDHGWQELVDSTGGGVSVEHVAGWGTLVRADLPYEATLGEATPRESTRSWSTHGGSPDFGSRHFGSPDFGSRHFGSPDFGSRHFGSRHFGSPHIGSNDSASNRSSSTHTASTQRAEPDPSPFTPREQEVAGLLARGLTDRSVAKALVISPKTVEKHVGALLRKTGTTNRTAAVMRALERGWLPSGSPAPG